MIASAPPGASGEPLEKPPAGARRPDVAIDAPMANIRHRFGGHLRAARGPTVAPPPQRTETPPRDPPTDPRGEGPASGPHRGHGRRRWADIRTLGRRAGESTENVRPVPADGTTGGAVHEGHQARRDCRR